MTTMILVMMMMMVMESNDNDVRRYLGIKLTSARAGIIVATKREGGGGWYIHVIQHILHNITTWDILSLSLYLFQS